MEDPYPDIPEFGSSEKSNTKIIYILIGVVIILIFVSVFISLSAKKSVCGDGICEVNENCYTCPKDCGCGSGEVCSKEKKMCVKLEGEKEKHGNGICDPGENCWDYPTDCRCKEDEYCSQEEKKCVKPKCGNGKCEGGEDQYTCCVDCECVLPGEECNEETNKCEPIKLNISDSRVKELVIDYFENNPEYEGLKISKVEVGGVSSYKNELVKLAVVFLENETYTITFGVSEKEEVVEIPIT